jgi:hypothetical protein
MLKDILPIESKVPVALAEATGVFKKGEADIKASRSA